MKPLKTDLYKTLKRRQQETGRTLALNGAAWRRLRQSVLDDEPLCRSCYEDNRIVNASDVDHIDNDPTNNDRSNLAALCHSCHSVKTQRDQGSKVVYGCDVNGLPLDPDHHWNK